MNDIKKLKNKIKELDNKISKCDNNIEKRKLEDQKYELTFNLIKRYEELKNKESNRIFNFLELIPFIKELK